MRAHDAVPLLALVLLAAAVTSTSASIVRPRSPLRRAGASRATRIEPLPHEVTPSDYDITLTPNMEEETFEGTVVITAKTNKATNTITLHSSGLTVEDAVTVKLGDDSLVVTESKPDDVAETLTINLAENVPPDVEITITIAYSGKLANDMDGFYISTYDFNGVTKKLAATQFETTSARKAFPCFDEPDLKANFTLTIHTEDGYNALFNTDESTDAGGAEDSLGKYFSSKTGSALRRYVADKEIRAGHSVTFVTTGFMSTYLVAFVVYDIDSYTYLELPGTADTARQRVWSNDDFKNQRQVALDVGAAALDAYGSLFPKFFRNMNTKLDQVAIPDFAAGAMENWGLVTYRERGLLIDESKSTTESQRSVVTTIAHELAHQWFGDYVTLKNWNTLWLNEGFATYWSYFVDLGKITEGWRLADQFLVQEMAAALDSDAVADTHAMTTDKDTIAPFDDIEYSKGGAVLRMFSNWIGLNQFHSRLNDYLKAHEHKTVTPDDLLTTLGGETLTEAMKTWPSKAGYPVISVTRNGDKTATLKQSRYLLTHSTEEAVEEPEWQTLVSYIRGNQSTTDSAETVWIKGAGNATISNVIDDEPLYLNHNWTGFYRVNYDVKGWELIRAQLTSDHKKIAKETRAQLLSDAFSLARSDHIKYQQALNISKYLSQEEDYLPWAIAFRAFDFLDTILAPITQYEDFKDYLNKLLEEPYKQVAYSVTEEDDHITRLHRVGVLKHMCRSGYQDCLDSANKLATEPLTFDVSPDLQSPTYCVWAQDTTKWNQMWTRYEETSMATEKVELLTALGCSQDEETLKKYLENTLDSTKIRLQDWKTVYTGVYSTPSGLDVAIEFISTNAAVLLGQDQSTLETIISGMATKIVTQEQLDKFQEMGNQDALTDLKVTIIDPAVALAEQQIGWAGHHVQEIGEWLKEYLAGVNNPESTSTTPDDSTPVPTTTETPDDGTGSSSVAAPQFLLWVSALIAGMLAPRF